MEDSQNLQAVMIADSFTEEFKSLNLSEPSCLMPVVNIPLISYTVEFLIFNHIKKLTIYAYEHYDKISSHIVSHKKENIEIVLVKCSDKPSVTSAFKDMDRMDQFKSDILLINSHNITNIDISEAIKAHEKRKKDDVPMIMTKIFFSVPLESRTRSKEDLLLIVEDCKTNQIMKYESIADKKTSNVNEFFEFKKKYHSELDIRMDLVDCDIDIVSPALVSILEEHSNYEQFRDDFINNVTESEIIVDKIFLYEIRGDKYFSRVNSYQGYFQTCMDVIQRKSFPLSPGEIIDSSSFIEYRSLIINQQGSCQFKGNNDKIGSFCVGDKTVVDFLATIKDSCIGPSSLIGEMSVITESILYGNNTIGQNCSISNCILAPGVSIQNDAVISDSLVINKDGENSYETIKLVYSNGKNLDGDDTDESDLIEDETDEDSDEVFEVTFEDEVKAIIKRQRDEDHQVDSVRVEVNSIKFSKHKSNSECVNAIFVGLINILMESGEEDIKKMIGTIHTNIANYAELIQNYLITENDQATLMESIEKCCIDHPSLNSGFHLLLQMCWKGKLLSDEQIIKWYETEVVNSHELRAKFLELSKGFVDHLKNQGEESDEEEEEESEESD
ncbi:unnamed protein product [Moneuplotes crassus]|uniref:Translation initiation factor eIF2B subunit epsilon n=1 Tax=Euplotes crassus TaxID=5936 RepID=A0AAD1UBZ0_EUPCR|nr:unnamed protein product [Moneuplotes crassus]